MSRTIILLLLGILLSACAGISADAPAPEPLQTPTGTSSTACNSPSDWTIQYNRSGGFAGWDESLILHSDGRLSIQSERPPADVEKTIPESDLSEITKLLVDACPFEENLSDTNCADCFLYNLQIQMDGQTYKVTASDVTLTETLRPLVDTLDKLLQDGEK